MSMDHCCECNKLIDTDYEMEVKKQDDIDVPWCDNCYQEEYNHYKSLYDKEKRWRIA
jgi:hypothetical protein